MGQKRKSVYSYKVTLGKPVLVQLGGLLFLHEDFTSSTPFESRVLCRYKKGRF